jgi:hypothetical protein
MFSLGVNAFTEKLANLGISGSRFRAPRKDGKRDLAWLQTAFSLSPGAKNPAKL